MSIKTTPRRLALLTNLISGFTATPEDDASVEREISVWITATAEEQGRKRSIVRRDLVLQNGFKGAGAQTRFASALLSALRGQPDTLLAALREGDREIVLDVLPESDTDTAPVEAAQPVEPVVEAAPEPVVEEAPVEAPAAPVKAAPPTSTPTRIWLERQCKEAGLVNRIAAVLKKRDRGTDFDEICSDVGLWLGEWGSKGTFDSVLDEKGSIPFSWLVRAVERKRTSTTYKEAQDALARRRGARTQHEINQRLELGVADYVAPDSLQSSGDLQVIYTKDEDKSGGAAWSHEIVTPETSPEDMVQQYLDRDHEVAEGREVVAAAYRGAVERYTAVYDALIDGASTEEIAIMDGCPESRAVALASKVRAALRAGGQTRDDARHTVTLLDEEPWSTKGEIKEHLRDKTGTVVDNPRWQRLVAYLSSHDLIKEGWGDTYALTR